MGCSMYVNVGRMPVSLNDESLEELDCYKYLWSEVAVDEGCEITVVQMNEGYKEWRALKNLLSNRVLGINLKNSI